VGNCRSLHLVTGRSYSVPREGVLSLLGDINTNECCKLVYIYATSGLSFNREFHKLYFLWPCKTCFLYIKNLWLLKSGFIWLSLASIAKSLPPLWSDYILKLKKRAMRYFFLTVLSNSIKSLPTSLVLLFLSSLNFSWSKINHII
jgi:hypothetical protein